MKGRHRDTPAASIHLCNLKGDGPIFTPARQKRKGKAGGGKLWQSGMQGSSERPVRVRVIAVQRHARHFHWHGQAADGHAGVQKASRDNLFKVVPLMETAGPFPFGQ